jgi:hypothetical protein
MLHFDAKVEYMYVKRLLCGNEKYLFDSGYLIAIIIMD